MKLYIISITILILLLGSKLYAQNNSSSVADSLMDRWVEIYNTDNFQALDAYYAKEIIEANDTRTNLKLDKKRIIADTKQRMGETKNLSVVPLYSYQEGNTAYQIGRWKITAPPGQLTGAHTFIWNKIDGSWKLIYMYYLHDPVALVEEYKKMKKK